MKHAVAYLTKHKATLTQPEFHIVEAIWTSLESEWAYTAEEYPYCDEHKGAFFRLWHPDEPQPSETSDLENGNRKLENTRDTEWRKNDESSVEKEQVEKEQVENEEDKNEAETIEEDEFDA